MNILQCYLNVGGGSTEAIQFLIDKGGNLNSIGRFGRSPLYRAAFAGHLDAVQVNNCYTVTLKTQSCKILRLAFT